MDNIHHNEDVVFTQDSLIGFIKCIKSDIRDTYHFVSIASMKSKDVSLFNDDEKEIAQIFVNLWNYKYDQQICVINQQIELIKDESGNIDIQKNQNSKRYTWIIGGNKLIFSPEETGDIAQNKLSGTFQIQENDNTNRNIRVQGFDNNGDFSNYQYVQISQSDLEQILNCPNEENFKNLEKLSHFIFYQKKDNNSYERLNSFAEIKNVAILSDQSSYGENQQGYQGIVLYYAEVEDGGGTIRTNTLECDNLFADSATLNNLNIIGDSATSFNSSLAIKDQTEADRWIETTESAISDGWTYNIINKDENSNYILSTNNDSNSSLTNFNFAVKENYQEDSGTVGYKIKNRQTVRCTGGNSQKPSSNNQKKIVNDLKLKINNQNQDVQEDQIYDVDYKNFFIIIQTTYTSSYGGYWTGYTWANPIEKKINLFNNSAGINPQEFLEELTSISKYKYLGFINKNTDNIYDSSQTYYEKVAPSDLYDFEFTNYDNLDESSWNSAISEDNIFIDSYEKNNNIIYNTYNNDINYHLFEEEASGTEIIEKQTYYKLNDDDILEEVTLENTIIRNTEHYYKIIENNTTVNSENFHYYIGLNQLFDDNNKLITYFNYNNNINYYIKDSNEDQYILIEGLNNKSDYEINKLLNNYSDIIKNQDIYKRTYNNLPAPNMETDVAYKGIEIAQINKYFNVVQDPSRTNIYNLYEKDEYGSYKKVINEPVFDNTKEYYCYNATCYEKVSAIESTWNSKIQEGLYIKDDDDTFYLIPNYSYPGQIANQEYYQLTTEASPFKYYQYNKVSIDDYNTTIGESNITYRQQIENDIGEGLYYSQSNNWMKLNNFNDYSSTVNYYTLDTNKISKIQGGKPKNWKWLALSGIYSIEDGNYIRISTPFVKFDSSKNYYIVSSYINDSSLNITTETAFNTYRDDDDKILLKVQNSLQEFVNFNNNQFEIVFLPEFIYISKYQLYNPEDTKQYYQRISNLNEINQGYQSVYLKKYYYSIKNWENKKYNLYIYRNNIYNKHNYSSNDYIRCEIGKYYSLDSDFYKRELIINGENVSNQTVKVHPAPGLGFDDAHVSGSITTLGGISARKSIMGFKVHGAVFNDYAEYRHTNKVMPGRCVVEIGDGDLEISKQRLQLGANIVSDTFGFSIGESNYANTPIAVCGRVLAYPLENRNSFKPGQAVCSGPNGTISIMTRDEIKEWPDAIVGYVSEIPIYKYWGSDNIEVDGRIWIKVK